MQGWYYSSSTTAVAALLFAVPSPSLPGGSAQVWGTMTNAMTNLLQDPFNEDDWDSYAKFTAEGLVQVRGPFFSRFLFRWLPPRDPMPLTCLHTREAHAGPAQGARSVSLRWCISLQLAG